MTLLYEPPDWVTSAIFYQIFPDRFSRGRDTKLSSGTRHGFQDWNSPPTLHGYKGGNLFGIINHLDYLKDLGITALYLNPIFASTANHRYHTHDYEKIDPLLGGLEAFRSLLEKAHHLDIRVIIDGVFNHCGRSFLQFADVIENGPDSPWAEWFRISAWPISPYDESKPANYAGWADHRALPVFNHKNPEVRDYLLGICAYWTEMGIDGWRLDAPEGVNCPHFWQYFRETVRAINPDAYLVGELVEFEDQWTNGKTFDGITNYPLWGATLDFIGRRHRDISKVNPQFVDSLPVIDGFQYVQHIETALAACRPVTSLSHLTFIDNHDNSRFSTLMGENPNLTELGILLLFTLPGVPCIYYGNEVGLQGGLDPDCRRGFPEEAAWNLDVLKVYKKLIALRKRRIALQKGSFFKLFASEDCIAFMRSFADESILVAINSGDSPATVNVDLMHINPYGSALTWPNQFNGEVLHGNEPINCDITDSGAKLVIQLEAQSGMIFTLG